MSLWLHVHGGYPSYAAAGTAWRGIDHDAHMFVQTLKGNPINGYVQMKDADGKWRKFTTQNPGPAFDIFGIWAAKALGALNLTGGHLVPVPTSSAIQLGQDAKGQRLAAAVACKFPLLTPSDGLHWHEELPKAAAGGPRDADELFENLMVVEHLAAPKYVVLVDDVVTTGGHLLACARALRQFGYKVEHAIAAAQTIWAQPVVATEIFNIPPRNLEADPLAF